MTIDAHQHFWKYSADQYGWIDETMSRIRRDFLPAELRKETTAAGVDAVISVQARTSIEETRWLLAMAGEHDWISAVVGWMPLTSPVLDVLLDGFAAYPKLRGVREVMQGREPGALLEPQFQEGMSALKERGLAYDLLIYSHQLDEAMEFVDRHPGQTIILDHIAKPRIREGKADPWAAQIRELARRPHVFCKVSGMVTEADPANWTADSLLPYFLEIAEAFSPARLMFGSDWPVCLVGTEYARWIEVVRSWTRDWSPDEQADILGRTACRAYGIEP